MNPLFESAPDLSEADRQSAKTLLECMMSGEGYQNHPLYKTFLLPESGVHVTPKWYLAKGGTPGPIVWDSVSLYVMAGQEGEPKNLVTVAILRRVPDHVLDILTPEPLVPQVCAPEKSRSFWSVLRGFWPTLVFWALFFLSWIVYGLSVLISYLRK